MDPIIHVLEKFKVEQDKIKVDAGENAIFEAKLDAMNKRVVHLEMLLGQVMDLGVEVKGSVNKAKDPYVLIDRIAERLANLDGSIDEPVSSTKDNAPRSRGPFGRKSRMKK
jgi:hypothetical protein